MTEGILAEQSEEPHTLAPMEERGHAERADRAVLDDPELVAEWRRLAELRANPFLTPDWYRAWLATGGQDQAFVLLWRREGELRGVLPLVRAGAGPVRTLRFAGSVMADWLEPACQPEDEAAMASACAELLSEEASAWHLLELDRIDADSTWPEALWQEGGRIAPARPGRHAVLPFIAFGSDGYEGYLAGRSRNFRSQLGRRRRRLEADHGLRFRRTTEREGLAEDLETFFRLHEERWAKRGGSAALSPTFEKMHESFSAAALERGWLRLWTAYIDGEPAAGWYGWRIGGRYCYALSGLRTAFEPLGLGTVLLAHTIEQAAAEGASVYDLMRGDDPYKARFETGRRSAATWVLGRRRHPVAIARGGIARLADRARALPAPLSAPLKHAYRRVARR